MACLHTITAQITISGTAIATELSEFLTALELPNQRVDLSPGNEQHSFATPSSREQARVSPVKRHKAGLLVREVDGEVLVLDPDRDQVHQLNQTAGLIWRHYDSGAEIDEIARALAMEFDVDEDKAQRDVRKAVDEFRRLELIT